MEMFCYQCEQTAKGTGCTTFGVCGKDPRTAALQDLLLYVTKGISMYAHSARQLGAKDREMDVFVVGGALHDGDERELRPGAREGHGPQGRDDARPREEALRGRRRRRRARRSSSWAARLRTSRRMTWRSSIRDGIDIGIRPRRSALGDDATGLQELLIYGVKGAAAYADHAQILGQEDDKVYAFFHEALDFLTKPTPTVSELVGYCLKTGEVNLRVMELLDAANTGAYGHPEPTRVRVTPVKGKAILVSGHDLKDLEALLKQTEGKGINVYTHGEMLPAHAYPGLKKYKHLVANYGGAWQNQAAGVRRVSGRDPDDDQLHPEAARGVQGAHIHERTRGVAGRYALSRGATSAPLSRKRLRRLASRRTRRSSTSWSALAGTRSWALRTRSSTP